MRSHHSMDEIFVKSRNGSSAACLMDPDREPALWINGGVITAHLKR